MKYFKYDDEEGITYLEDDEGCPYRQITIGDGEFNASNINYPKWGPCLGECGDPIDDYEGVISISKDEFDSVWNAHLERYSPQWEAAKARYPLGKAVVGAMLVFYPQGVLVDLGPDAVGLADYAQCHASAPPAWMYPKHKIRAVVAGYDQDNQWIELQEPQVLQECVR